MMPDETRSGKTMLGATVPVLAAAGVAAPGIRERTVLALRQLLDKVQNHVHGFERTMVTRGLQMLYPRVVQRIERASEVDLESELRNLRAMINEVLGDDKQSEKMTLSGDLGTTQTTTKRNTRSRHVRPGTTRRKRPNGTARRRLDHPGPARRPPA